MYTLRKTCVLPFRAGFRDHGHYRTVRGAHWQAAHRLLLCSTILCSALEILAFIPLSQDKYKIGEKMSKLILPKIIVREDLHRTVLVFSSLALCHPAYA